MGSEAHAQGPPHGAGGHREALAALAILVALLCLTYANVVFRGRSLVYSDNYNPLDERWLPQNYGPGFVPAAEWTSRNLLPYANFHDPGGSWWQWEPGGEFLRRALARREWPWWDPYVGAGAPAMANLSQTFFFPPYALVVALGDSSLLRTIYSLSFPLVAAFASYLLLRRHGLSREGALGGATAMLFCGGIAQNIGSFVGQTAALLPPLLLLTRWFLDWPSWRRTAALAAGYGLAALSSFPPLLVADFGIAAAYAGVLIATDADRRRRARRYGLAVALSLGLVAFCYLPAFAAIRSAPQVARTYQGAALVTVPWAALPQLLSPVLAAGDKVYAPPPVDGGKARLPYVGGVVLLLAGLAAPPAPREGRLLFLVLAGSGVVATLKLLGVQPVQSLGLLPGLDQIHFATYFGITLAMLLCLGAAFGLDRLLTGKVGASRLALVGGGLGAVVLGLPAFAFARRVFGHPAAASWLGHWYLLVGVVALAVGLAAACGNGAWGSRRPLWTAALLALLAAEGILDTAYPRQQRWDVWDHPVPYVRVLQAERSRGRVFAAGAFAANAASAFEVFGLDSLMTVNAPRVFELYRRYAAPRAYLFLREAERLPPEGVLDAANVGLLALRELRAAVVAEAVGRGYRQLWGDGVVRVLARPTAPRYFFTSQYRVMAANRVLAAVAESRPAREVLLEAPPPVQAAPNGSGDPAVAARVERNRVLLRLRAPRPGLVYCSEAQAPGWRALVNGAQVPILAANYAFRAVPVPRGDVVVELSYVPPGLPSGLALSAAAAISLLLLALRRDRVALAPLAPRAQRWGWPLPRRLVLGLCILLALSVVVSEIGRRRVVAAAPPAAFLDPLRARPQSFYRVAWGAVRLPAALDAGSEAILTVSLRNAGRETWPDPQLADPVKRNGAGAVRLAYRWLRDDDTVVVDYDRRFDLPAPVAPGETLVLPIVVRLPNEPGAYRLQVDLVHELVTWFEKQGGDRLVVPVTVRQR